MPAPRERDLERTRRDLEAWIAARMPAARDVSVGELTGPGTTGFSSDTLLFDATWREGGAERRGAWVARLKPTGVGVFPEYDIARQFEIQRALGATEVPVARMLWLEQDASVLGTPFYVMEQVAGRAPSDNPPYHIAGWVTEIAPAEREALWWSGLDVLARIHRLDWRGLGLGFLDPGGDPLDAQLAYWDRYRAFARGRPHPLLERATAWLRANRPPAPEPTVLCWGDARIGNMLFHDGRCLAVLDWEMACVGSPEMDLAWFLFLDRHHCQGMGVPRLPGFPSREETVARYEKRTGHAVRHLHWYEVLAAFRFSAIMARIAQQMTHYGVLPPDAELEVDNPCTRLLARLLES
jgi:aminoglycoside phosphotransferase (APT) family kinase protein